VTERQNLPLWKGKMRPREPSKGIGNAFKLSAFQVGCDRSANLALRRGGNDRVANFATRRGSAATARAIASWLVSLRINEKPCWQVASRVRRVRERSVKVHLKTFPLPVVVPNSQVAFHNRSIVCAKIAKTQFLSALPVPHSSLPSQVARVS